MLSKFMPYHPVMSAMGVAMVVTIVRMDITLFCRTLMCLWYPLRIWKM